MEVCERGQEAFKSNMIPGTIEAEDYDKGCPGDAYYDVDEINEGGKYRSQQGVDIDTCLAGGYTLGWTRRGEWLNYTVTVAESAMYQVSFYVATSTDSGKLHLEIDGVNISDVISIPNTMGFQNWAVIKKSIQLQAGQNILKLAIDGAPFNLDKMHFEIIK
jgi:hypothetical protein